ncbi:MAG: hypothetical protein EAZ93_05545 [Oscillatoriales cyanobacterium]|jgi:hypothetical protein|nr:MAG: hypothetical protein EAZ93_05545 [Oscillatoriales cyanobacterium]
MNKIKFHLDENVTLVANLLSSCENMGSFLQVQFDNISVTIKNILAILSQINDFYPIRSV